MFFLNYFTHRHCTIMNLTYIFLLIKNKLTRKGKILIYVLVIVPSGSNGVMHRHANLCTAFRALITPGWRVFGHDVIGPYVTMDLITRVCNHKLIVVLSSQFSTHIFLYLPMPFYALFVVFWICVFQVSFLIEGIWFLWSLESPALLTLPV